MCENKCCCSCGENSQNNSTENKVENVYNTLPGHPIIMIDDPSDILLFNSLTGDGFGIWEGWSFMDGNTRYDINNGKAAIVCANMMDRCPVMANDSYSVGDVFGSDSVALVASENGIHTHIITDPGHIHGITDPGHTHIVTDPTHTHTITDPGHAHGVTNTMALSKNIASASHVDSDVQVADGTDHDVPDTWTDQTINLSGSVVVNTNTTGVTLTPTASGVTIAPANTSETVDSEVTGITLANSGSGTAHENRQPSYALLFIKRIYVPV